MSARELRFRLWLLHVTKLGLRLRVVGLMIQREVTLSQLVLYRCVRICIGDIE